MKAMVWPSGDQASRSDIPHAPRGRSLVGCHRVHHDAVAGDGEFSGIGCPVEIGHRGSRSADGCRRTAVSTTQTSSTELQSAPGIAAAS